MPTNFDILDNNACLPLEYGLLKERFSAYKFPKNKIARMVKDGKIIRLTKGLYVPVAEKSKNQSYAMEAIANRLYGPSYVSLHWALMYYGIIPERVYEIGSMSVKRGAIYHTQIGRFRYVHAKKEYFSIGITRVVTNDYSFVIATPEKAICDLIMATPNLHLQSPKAMREYIEEDMRMDVDALGDANCEILDEVIKVGVKQREIRLLKEYIQHAGTKSI
jgi:hypothetical protein